MSDHAASTIDDLIDLLVGIWRSAVMKAAYELNVVDHLKAGRATAAEVAEAEKADPRRMRMLLDAFTSLGLADKTGERYALTPLADGVMSSSTGAIGTATPIWLGDAMWNTWARASGVVRSGQKLPADPALSAFFGLFSRATLELARLVGGVTASALGLQPGSGWRVLDVGCGSAGIGIAMAEADPSLTVVGVDLDAVPAARQHAERFGVADRVEIREADIVSPEPFGDAEFDVGILSHILHGVAAADAERLVGKVAAALRPGGRIVINEYVPDPERKREAVPLMFGLLMGLLNDGDAYTEAELRGWLEGAGFGDIAFGTPAGYVTQIVATKR